jgi:BirA family biotin operon repressor/biotin-[acetyl-CoA-carboxylase] ligase
LLKELIASGEWPEGERFIRADYQTAGRGQAGNGWESEKGKNLLCSILVESQKTKDKRPFYLNIAVSVAVHKVIQSFVLEHGGLPVAVRIEQGLLSLSEAVSIKWPNDIYWQDKKVAGILIENAIVGSELKYSLAGIGLNVNQTEWHSDAPNPISLKLIDGVERKIEDLMDRLMEEFDAEMKMTADELWAYYKAHLYRREGMWPFVEREVTTAPTMNANSSENAFMACIEDVLPTGEIVLKDETGNERKYHFKQVRYVI